MNPQPLKRRCCAENRQGLPCARWPVKGRARCRLHGGAPGSGRGNYSSRIYVQHLQIGDAEAFHEALEAGGLDRMRSACALAAAQLNGYLREHGLAVVGGQVVARDGHGGGSIDLHVNVVLRHLEKIAKLERVLAELQALAVAREDHADVDRWLAALVGPPPGGDGGPDEGGLRRDPQ